MMTLPLIQIIAASKAYPTHDGGIFHALQQINLDIAAGDIFGLIGKSGAGKSSLLRLINLLERPDTGSIIVASQDLTKPNKKALRRARQQIGMIFQQFNLLQNTNVFDNVAFPLKIHGGLNKQDIHARVQECLAIVGLEEKAHSYPAQLSGGQKLRVINQRLGVTIVIVSHELAVLSKLCNHVAVIVDGDIAESFALADTSQLRSTALGRELICHWHEEHARPLPEGLAHV